MVQSKKIQNSIKEEEETSARLLTNALYLIDWLSMSQKFSLIA
jgi:hypothetical protein